MRRSWLVPAFVAAALVVLGLRELDETRTDRAQGSGSASTTTSERARPGSRGHANADAASFATNEPTSTAEDSVSVRIAYLESRMAESRNDPRFAASERGGRIVAGNPEQRFEIAFGDGRALITTEGPARGVRQRVVLETERIGCGASTETLRATSVSTSTDDPRRVSMPRETGLVRAEEWFVNGGAGLEQGFTVASAACGDEPLVVEVGLRGLHARLDDGRVMLGANDGLDRFSYGDLFAIDADGRRLETRLALVDDRARLEVDLDGARFPVVVDPLLVNLEAILQPDSPGHGMADMNFGNRVAIAGNTAAVATMNDVYGGSVWIFVRSGTTWTLQQRLTNPNHTPGSWPYNGGFGASVALSGDTLVVGNEEYLDDGTDQGWASGSVNVYVRSGTTWSFQAALVRGVMSADYYTNEGFGTTVSIAGDVIAAGAPGESSGRGAVYLFRRSGTVWSAPTRLVATLQQSSARFGADVAVAGTYLVVGEPGRSVALNAAQGNAMLYRDTGSGYTVSATLTATDGAAQDRFGETVDVDPVGPRILVGSPLDDTTVTDGGSAYVFLYDGTTALQEAKLVPSGTANASQSCGLDVALVDTLALVGCPHKRPGSVQTGAAHAFSRSGATWTDLGARVPANALANDLVGNSVALDGMLGLVGAPRWADMERSGQGEVMVLAGSSLTFEAYLALGRGAYDDQFGQAIAASGDTVVVGVPNHDVVGAQSSGAVYVFVRTGPGTFALQAKLLSPVALSDRFGDSVDLEGDVLVVGAPYHNPGSAAAAGAVYVYRRSAGTWGSPTRVTAESPSVSSFFGDSVALSGNYLIVGEPYYDAGATLNVGRVHFFEWSGSAWGFRNAIVPSVVAANNNVGIQVDLSDSLAIAGAPSTNIGGTANRGAAYVFRRNAGTGLWSEQTPRLALGTGTGAARFGASVAVQGTTVLVGAPWDQSNRGTVFAYADTGGSFGAPTAIAPATSVSNENFGTSLAYDRSVLAVGSLGQARYFYGSGTVFAEEGMLSPPMSIGSGSGFGGAVAVTAGHLYVGAPMASGNTPLEGRAAAYSVGGFRGDACSTDQQCGSGNCVDGVCCNTTCGGGSTSDCQACSVAAGAPTDGLCAPVLAALNQVCRAADATGCDVAEVCTGTASCPVDAKAANGSSCGGSPSGACDAQDTCLSGACQANYANSSTQCAAGSCTDGVSTSAVFCTGTTATCGTGTAMDCGGFACGATSCLTTCTSDAQCEAAYYCNGSMACAPKLADGASCSTANQCQSGMCNVICGGDVDECMLGTDDCSANATCTNTIGSFTCACNSGYTGDGVTCTDVNECATNNGGCAPAPSASCTNVPGSRTCACNSGYTGDGVTCTDVNECATNNGGCSTTPMVACTNTAGSRTCGACPSGYAGDGVTCTDVDECLTNNGGCSTNPMVSCTNEIGSRLCGSCPSGYTGDGVTCSDVNECTLGIDNCSDNATCTNTPGSFSCTCNGGYSGTGQSCADVNECTAGTDNCSNDATCSNVTGTFTCSCNAGFTGTGVICTDVNECLTNNGGCSTAPMVSCTNIPGSRTCGACPSGYSGDGTSCTDVDECVAGTDTCTATQACTNTLGGFTCTSCDANASVQSVAGAEACVCDSGYGGDGQTCTANACDPACGTGANCTAAFTCVCPAGYSGDPLVSCTDLDECTLGTDTCSVDADCTNTTGWYSCACKLGFTGTGTTCADIDECALGTDDCSPNADCFNVPGTFSCSCRSGYVGNGRSCVPIGTDAGVTGDAGTDAGNVDAGGTDAAVTGDAGSDSGSSTALRSEPSVGLCATSQAVGSKGGRSGASAIGIMLFAGLVALLRRHRRDRREPGAPRARRVVALVALVGTALAMPFTASAQTTDESVARAQFQLGQAYLTEGRFHEAAVAFEAAYAASNRPGLLYNAYVAYRDAQELESAANALRRFLEADPNSDTPLMRSRLQAIETQLASQRAAAEAAEQRRLEEERRAAERAQATSTVSTPLEQDVSTTPAATSPSAEGSSGNRGLAFGLIGGGAGLAAVGMLAGGLGAAAQSDRLADYCGASAGLPSGQCFDVPAVDDIESKTTMFRAIAWSSLAVGVSAAAVGTVLLFTGSSDDEQPAVSVAPTCDRAGCSLSVFGRF